MPQYNTRNKGCWTCRLRRKKCDSARPVCTACAVLHIKCHYDDCKPEWMDGATKQREMMESVKSQIKKGASARREIQRTTSSQPNQELRFVLTLNDDFADKSNGSTTSVPDNSDTPSTDEPQTISSPTNTHAQRLPGTTANNSHFNSISPLLALTRSRPTDQDSSRAGTLNSAWDMDFVMMYLDHVFPFIFPFYRPPLVGTSRAWLLKFLTQNDAVFHCVISLSSYFFTCGLNELVPGRHENCKEVVWEQVLHQADLSFELIQKYLKDVNHGSTQSTLIEKAHLMESIIQLLIFEAFLSRSTSWEFHLPPAIALFEEIIQYRSCQLEIPLSRETGLRYVLDSLLEHPPSSTQFERFVCSPNQESFRFFTATLLYIDIIAGASLGRPSQLSKYHSLLMDDLKPLEINISVDLFYVVGCKNWVLRTIDEITTLDCWKKEMHRAGSLSIPDLVGRSAQISQTLATGLSEMENEIETASMDAGLTFQSPYDNRAVATYASLEATQIWAITAQLYLFVVVSGWQPANYEVEQNTKRLIQLLESISSAAQVRALAWPVCVAGCLTNDDGHKQRVINLIDKCDRQKALSTLQEAKRTMVAVWSRSEASSQESWDLQACFKILDGPPLLI